MSVDSATVRRIAHLARISVNEDEIAPLQNELNAILAFVEQLNEVDVAHVEPMTSVRRQRTVLPRSGSCRWNRAR